MRKILNSLRGGFEGFAERSRQKDYVQALMAGAALVAMADRDQRLSELVTRDRVLARLAELQPVNIREAGGVTFYYVAGYWVQSGIKAEDLEDATRIEYMSDAYFDLLATGDEVKSFLAVGTYVIYRLNGKTFMIVPRDEDKGSSD